MTKKILFALTFSLFFCGRVQSQGTAGKDFWVGFMAQSWDCYSSSTWWNNDTPMLFISSQIAAVVTIDAPDIAFTRTVTLIPNQTYSLLLPREVVCRYSDTITQNGVHVTSDDIINVYAVNRFWYSKGATVVIPTTSIVKSPEYIITTDEDTYNWNWSCNGKNFRSPEFVIVGVADSSVIEIVPKGASTRNSIANVPFQITLKKGETFQYMSTDVDLTGSIIRSKYPDSKYSVFAGNRLTVKQGVDANGGTCYSSFDHNYEQMTPTVTWGNKYTAIPFKNSEGGYYLKVVAAENNTRISINGTYYKTLNQAQYFEYMLYTDTLTTISSTNRISVAQFVKGYNCIKHPTKPYLGDPAQMQLFPDEQFGNNATVNTVSQTNYWWWNNNPWWWQNAAPEHFINVMVKTGDTAEFKINNNKVPGSEWKGFSTGNQYAYTQIKIDSGSHYMSSTKGFLSYVYGYGWFEGYAYAAAAKFRPIQNNFIITNAQCKKDTVNFQAIENDSFGNFTWKFGDGATASGPKVKHKYADTGWYSVKMYCRHVITNVLDSVQKDLYIADTKIKSLFNKDTAICGPVNIIVLTKGFNMDNTYRWNDGHQVYYRAIKNPGINWCEVTERNGCVFRDTLKITNSGIPKANFSVSNDTFCLNKSDNITFKNLSVSKDTIESYKWDFGEKTLSSFDTVLSYKFKNANTYAVMLKATTIYGCYHDTFQIVDVMTSPKADFSFTQKDTCYIKNGIRLQNNTVIPDVKDLKRFKWYFSEGFNISNSNPAGVRTYATPGNYKVMLIYEYKNLCIDTMVQSLTIYPHPKAAFSVISPSMCTLDSIKFKATSQSAYKPLYNQWVWGDSTANKNSFDSFAKHPYAKFGSYNVKLISTSPQGCTDTIKHLISLDESPKISFLTNRDTQCYRGHSFTFTNTTTIDSGRMQFLWTLGDGNTSTDSNVLNKTYSTANTYNVNLKATSSKGCVSTLTQPIALGAHPTGNFSINTAQQCYRSNSFTFTNNSTISPGSIASSQWNMGDGNILTSTNVTNHRYLSEDTFGVRLISTSHLGCSDTITKQVVTYAQPQSLFSINQAVQCLKQQRFVYTNQSSIKYGKMLYNWQLGDGSSSTDSNIVKQYIKDSTYTVRLITRNIYGCADTSVKTVTLYTSPTSAFTVAKAEQCYRGHSFNITNTSSIVKGSITQYTWQMGNGSVYTTKDVTNHQYGSEDSFNVKLISLSNNGCRDTAMTRLVTFAQPTAKFVIPNDTQCWQKHYFNFNNQTTLKYGTLTNFWQFGDNTTSTEFNPSSKSYANVSASYLVKYRTVTEHGCSDSFSRRIVLLERPLANFGINDSIQCFKDHLFSFTNTTGFSVPSSLSYWWQYANGNSSSGYQPQTASYTTAGIYPVQLVAYSYLTNCYDTLIKPIVAAPHANVGFNINKDTQCLRFNDFKFINQSSVQFGSIQYSWTKGDGSSTDTNRNTSHHYTIQATYPVKLVVTTNYDCKDSLTKNIQFFATPVAKQVVNDNVQCYNAHAYDFTNNSTLAQGTFTQNWQFADGSSHSTKDITNKTFNQSGDIAYYLAVVSDKGCTDTSRSSIYLEKNRNISIGLNANDNDSQCLKGNSFRFVPVNNNARVTISSYDWQYGDGQSSNSATPIAQVFNKAGEFSVRLFIQTANGCLDSGLFQVVVHPQPLSNFSASDVCFPEPIQFVNSSSISTGIIANSKWYYGDGTTSFGTNPKHYYKSAQLYDVSLVSTSEYGCSDSIFKAGSANVKLKPRAGFSMSRLATIQQDEIRLQFNNASSSDVNQYIWDFGNNSSSTDSDPLNIYKDTGRYTVSQIVFNKEGCSDTLVLPTGLLLPDFFYYLPNTFTPNHNNLNEVFKGVGSQYTYRFTMEIYNRWGEKVFESDDISKGWDGTYKGADCMEGVYLCRVYVIPLYGPKRAIEQTITLIR